MMSDEPSLKGAGMPVALVVEDEALIEWMLTDVLQECGFEVVPARTLADASAILASRPDLDVFILDSGLPDGDGLSLIPEIRGKFPDARIAAATGRSDAKVDGVTLFVKPYDISDIGDFVSATGLTTRGRAPGS